MITRASQLPRDTRLVDEAYGKRLRNVLDFSWSVDSQNLSSQLQNNSKNTSRWIGELG